MRKPCLISLRAKFLLPLLLVAGIALSAAILLRGFIISDFRQFLQGDAEDRIQMVLTDLEGKYERYGGFRPDSLAENSIWALLLGVETRVYDSADHEVMNSRRAIDSLAPLMKKRVEAAIDRRVPGKGGAYLPYPLFLGGKEIGRLEVRQIEPVNEGVFVGKSDRFLLYITLALGGLVILLSIFASRRLTAPIRRLTTAAKEIADGDYASRVPVKGCDELATLAGSFNAMAGSLETQERLRKKLMANAAHELRTPLMVIRGELEGMMDGVLPLARESLQSLHEESVRLAVILEGIEELTQAEASSLSLNRQSIPLAPFLAGMAGRFGLLCADREVAIKVDCADGTVALADPDRLSQVMINLISNAIKASSPGGEICISGRSEGAETVLEVADTGRGIPAAELPFIFERFYRGSKGGLGLGLAIVQELVQAHGGTVNAMSEEEGRTVLTVRLPAK